MVSSLNRRSKKSTEVQATVSRIAGRVIVGAPPPRSRMRTPLSSTRGFHPSQPVASASISTGWPMCRSRNRVRLAELPLQQLGQAAPIAFELGKNHEPNREQHQTKGNDGCEQKNADGACRRLQPGGICGEEFRRCAHGGHNNRQVY